MVTKLFLRNNTIMLSHLQGTTNEKKLKIGKEVGWLLNLKFYLK